VGKSSFAAAAAGHAVGQTCVKRAPAASLHTSPGAARVVQQTLWPRPPLPGIAQPWASTSTPHARRCRSAHRPWRRSSGTLAAASQRCRWPPTMSTAVTRSSCSMTCCAARCVKRRRRGASGGGDMYIRKRGGCAGTPTCLGEWRAHVSRSNSGTREPVPPLLLGCTDFRCCHLLDPTRWQTLATVADWLEAVRLLYGPLPMPYLALVGCKVDLLAATSPCCSGCDTACASSRCSSAAGRCRGVAGGGAVVAGSRSCPSSRSQSGTQQQPRNNAAAVSARQRASSAGQRQAAVDAFSPLTAAAPLRPGSSGPRTAWAEPSGCCRPAEGSPAAAARALSRRAECLAEHKLMAAAHGMYRCADGEAGSLSVCVSLARHRRYPRLPPAAVSYHRMRLLCVFHMHKSASLRTPRPLPPLHVPSPVLHSVRSRGMRC
jgi:hypothetical protein